MIIGLDVGGTHTDAVLLDRQGLQKETKVPTDPSDLFHSVLRGLDTITEGIERRRIKRLVLSTTLSTNAIVENKLPAVGMIVSSGPGIDPEYFRTNSFYYAVSGSIDHRGREIAPVDLRQIQDVAEKLEKQGIRHVGVAGKFAVRNPAHEQQIATILQERFEKVFLSHRISGNLNFPRRIATTYLNAAVYPVHRQFYEAVKKSLAAKGLALPLRLLKADGGNMKLEASIELPGQTILSGPAASVMGALAFGPQDEDALVMDIGGTTTDLAVLINRAPVLDPLGIKIGDFKTLIRSLETLSIGLGGDSTVNLQAGRLQVGPRRRGPAMAFGGPAPTPTDALFVREDIRHGDRRRAAEGIQALAQSLGSSVETAAATILDVTCKKILSAARRLIDRINSKPVYTVHELQEGYTVRPRILLVLGGPAPYFAPYLETLSDYRVQVVPRCKVANAIGAALARTTCDVALFADTARHLAVAPEENYSRRVEKNFDRRAAEDVALELVRRKAIARGANPEQLETEIIESLEFNMVRGFYTTGKNIRVKAQVKPGLIHGYDQILAADTQGAC